MEEHKTDYEHKLKELLYFYDSYPHPPESCIDEPFLKVVQEACVHMMERDGPVTVLDNEKGQLCPSYPPQIVLPSIVAAARVQEAVNKAKSARYRQRFAVPVLSFKGAYVCRSAAPAAPATDDQEPDGEVATSWTDLYRRDYELLRYFSVHYLLNMMSEEVVIEHGVRCCVAEQLADRELYTSSPLNLCVVPYPGVKLFHSWKSRGYNDRLTYNWEKCSAQLDVPYLLQRSEDDWPQHQSWDLRSLTQRYFRFIVSLLNCGGGILIHCRSGWDRTPMWLSLLRISLWADGEVHESLSAAELTYLTVAYDWMLFGHDLKGRRAKGQEIMLFTFHFLSAIESPEYSITACSTEATSTGSEKQSRRASRLLEVRRIFTQAYSECFSKQG